MKTMSVLAVTLVATAMFASAARGGNPELPLNLGAAGDFVILAKSGISTVPNSDITGDIGVSPIAAGAITGFALMLDLPSAGQFATSAQVTGKIYATDYAVPTPSKMSAAIGAMETAFTAAENRTIPDTTELMDGDISNLIIKPGLHKWSTGVLISENVTLDAEGNADAVFIFQIAQGLTMASGKRVILTGGAQAKNIFWQVKTDATINTTAHFEGILLTGTAIHLRTGASFNGKLLAQTAVTLDQNIIMDADLIAPPVVRLEIVSAHGTGTPPTGVYFNVIGSRLTNSITLSETFGGTQYVNTGWSMLGNVPASGATNGMSMVQTNNAVLTWSWTTNYYLSLTSVHGSITNDTPGWKPAGQGYVLYPVPDVGYAFDHWEVNGGNHGVGVPLTGTMDEAKNVVAFFKSTFIDVSELLVWNIKWVCVPCQGYLFGHLTIANNDRSKSLTAPIWYEVPNSPLYWLRNPTGFDADTGLNYLDISAAVANQLLMTGNGDLALDFGESVTITTIELMGENIPTGLLKGVWSDPSGAGVVSLDVTGVAFAMSLPDSFAEAAKVKVSGLPAGLKYNAATRTITGVPTKAGAFAVVISASGMPAETITVWIRVLPTWAQGAFNGAVEGGGVASMTVSAQGKVTGKLAVGGTSYAFSAASFAAGGNAEDGFLVDAVAKSGQTLLPLTLRVARAVAPAMPSLGVALGQVGGAPLALYRNVWKEAGTLLAPYIGYYTATLPGGEEHGSGYLTFTVDKAGKVKAAGKLADGTTVSLAGVLIVDDAGRVWTVVYAAPGAYKGGSLFGIAEFATPVGEPVILRPLGGGSFLWQSLNPLATQVYGEGFDRELTLSGGWYDKTGNLYRYYSDKALAVGTDAAAPTPEVWVGNVAYESVAWDPDGIALTVATNRSGVMTGGAAPRAGLPVKAGGVWDYGADNSVGLKVTLTRATGVFNGSFKAWFDYAASHTPRNIALTGVLTPEREDKEDGVAGRGFFLWADKAQYLNPRNKNVPYSFKWSYDLKLLLSEPTQ